MTSVPQAAFRPLDEEERHSTHRAAHHARTRLPVIPDLRFESSYIRSVRRYIEVERVESTPTVAELINQAMVTEYGTIDEQGNIEIVEKEFTERVIAVVPSGPREIIRVQWSSVIWVTIRDQVISPLVQGAVWALASYYITPFSSQLGSRMGTFVHGTIPTKEGLGVTWLRNWAKNIGFSSNGNGSMTTQKPITSNNYRY